MKLNILLFHKDKTIEALTGKTNAILRGSLLLLASDRWPTTQSNFVKQCSVKCSWDSEGTEVRIQWQQLSFSFSFSFGHANIVVYISLLKNRWRAQRSTAYIPSQLELDRPAILSYISKKKKNCSFAMVSFMIHGLMNLHLWVQAV